MATDANTFPLMKDNFKDSFAEKEKFTKVKDVLKEKISHPKKCKTCGKEPCKCEKIRTP